MIRLGKLVGMILVMALTNFWVIGTYLRMGWLECTALFLVLLLCFIVLNVAPLWKKGNFSRLGVLLGGEALVEICVITFTVNIVLTIFYGFLLLPDRLQLGTYILQIVLLLLFSGVLIINGCARMFFTSVQLGIKWRVLFFLLWWVPTVNLILLWKVCRIVRAEYAFEMEKRALNEIRKQNESCKTRYPLVLVHGVFFRDQKFFNYWGRIPGELLRNGATVYYGEQQSAASTEAAAAELKNRILSIVQESGCGKVNIIAHSKGGLEARCVISRLGLAPYVASLTTINTPHRGCAYVDWLLEKMPKCICDWIANRYNGTLRRLGDDQPDFYAAVCDLTSQRCEAFNRETPDAPEVYYQSVGSKMKGWTSAPFPQNISYLLVRHFHRENDGLVGVPAMKWGENFHVLTASGRRGISHGDMIDLNRQNIRGFDVREFYVWLVRELKNQGY